MNKADFVKLLKETGGFETAVEAGNLFDCFVACMEKVVSEKRALNLPGFGSFKVVARAARQGRNPKTGAVISIPARNVLKFTPAAKMKAVL